MLMAPKGMSDRPEPRGQVAVRPAELADSPDVSSSNEPCQSSRMLICPQNLAIRPERAWVVSPARSGARVWGRPRSERRERGQPKTYSKPQYQQRRPRGVGSAHGDKGNAVIKSADRAVWLDGRLGLVDQAIHRLSTGCQSPCSVGTEREHLHGVVLEVAGNTQSAPRLLEGEAPSDIGPGLEGGRPAGYCSIFVLVTIRECVAGMRECVVEKGGGYM